ncbi:MAG TPA: PHP domain-containing protein [Chthoniobacterales bacterium]|nr:PHP domain-containing protein [Chthoniobacterales bacterium]
MQPRINLPPSNAEIAELLSLDASNASYVLQRAFRRAARSAFLWEVEVRDLVARKEPLTQLAHVGPFLEKQIRQWIRRKRHPPRPPSLRKEFFTLAESRARLSKATSWRVRLRGDLQMHTQWSDGSADIRAMAEAAIARGYVYIAITDHSKGLPIANGIDEAKLKQQSAEIDAVNRELRAVGKRFTVLHSIELNLNPAGQGDMDAKALRSLDLVLGSFHSALRRKDDQTERYLAALRNPHIQILGHPRGRIYNYRAGLRADWETVFREATRLDKAVEIDAYPDRQDLNFSLLRIVKRCGTRISMGTDAHHPWQLEFIDLALTAALAAKISAERIVNFMSLNELLAWVRNVRRAQAQRQRARNTTRDHY